MACPDGVSAVRELERSRVRGVSYDCMVTDIFLPDIGGLEILKVVKAQHPGLPVVVITGFGDASTEREALSSPNTAYLDKPFTHSDLVQAIESLSPGNGTLDNAATAQSDGDGVEPDSAYLTVRIADETRCLDVYWELSSLDGVQSCVAVRGDVDIILRGHATERSTLDDLYARVRGVDGVELVSTLAVERLELDREIQAFVDVYREAAKASPEASTAEPSGLGSCFIVDIDTDAVQQVFTSVFFLDNVVFCDVVDGGTKLLGMHVDHQSVGRQPRIIEKIGEIDGVLRVREARVVDLTGGS